MAKLCPNFGEVVSGNKTIIGEFFFYSKQERF